MIHPLLMFHFKDPFYFYANAINTRKTNYSMIWFLKLLLRSLCGRTMELSMMTSDGIFTLQPDETEGEAVFRWIAIKYIIYSWWCPIKLPRIVMEGVSFPSLKSVSLSILAYGSLGFGSLGVPSTLAHLPMVLPQPTMLFNTQLWSYGRQSVYILYVVLWVINFNSQTKQYGENVAWTHL